MSNGGLSPGLSGQLADIYSNYPKDSFQCDCAANETLDAFKQSGMDGKIVQLETGLDTMMSSDGTVISRNGFHQAVQVDDRFYDALTGSEGATWDVYQTLIQQDQFHPLTVTEPRPYIPPQR